MMLRQSLLMFAATAAAFAACGESRSFASTAQAEAMIGQMAATDAASGCRRTGSSLVYSSTNKNDYSWKNFGRYNLAINDWGPDPGALTMWINAPDCWGVETSNHADNGAPRSYPNVSRGWLYHSGLLQALSTSGFPAAPDWTTQSGMGIPVTSLRKAHVKWSISTPTTPNEENRISRWDALIDVYFHNEANPSASAFPPQIDLQIMQMLMDQPLQHSSPATSGYYATVMSRNHPFVKTIGGVRYVGVLDISRYNRPGGHTITLMVAPTMYTDPETAGLLWGRPTVMHDVGGIVAWLSSAAPRDDSGQALHYADGGLVLEPVIAPSLYLTAVNAGFEINSGTAPKDNHWSTNGFWVSVQDEQDGP